MTRNFKSIYGYDPHANTFTPGRVNLIGEHIDYNGGMVLPAALPVGVEISIGSRSDDIISIASTAFEDVITTRFDQEKSGVWSDYVLGAMKFARSEGMIDKGVDLFIHSSVPVGAGLSSSAAVIVGVLKTCKPIRILRLLLVKLKMNLLACLAVLWIKWPLQSYSMVKRSR